MTDLRTAAQQALEALVDIEWSNNSQWQSDRAKGAITALRAALAEPPTNQCGETCERAKLCAVCAGGLAEPTVKESLQVPAEVAATLTTTDIAWLETRRLTRLWKELGQMRWAGADKGWDNAIESVRNRLDKECQAVLDWKAKADQSQATAIELLQKMQGVKDD